MTQHIGCIIEDENHKLIKDSELNFATINDVLGELDPGRKRYAWLTSIAQYDDTTFNNLQIPYIVAEFEKLKNEVDKGSQNLIQKFIAFIKEGYGNYVKFLGD